MTSTVVVRQLAPTEFAEGAKILAEAFAEEQMFAFLLGKDLATRARALQHFFRGSLRAMRPFAELHAATLDDELVGVGICVPPGEYPVRAKRLPGVVWRQLPGLIRMITICPGARRLLTLGAQLEGGAPKGEPYWYAMHAAVRADCRRRGVATALARELNRRADEQGVGIYAETAGEGTLALCLENGFRIIQEATLFAGGPKGWRVWRDPAPGGEG